MKLLTSLANSLPVHRVVGWLFCPSRAFASTVTPSEDLNTDIIFILRHLLVLSAREMNELFYHRKERSEYYSEWIHDLFCLGKIKWEGLHTTKQS